MKLIRNGSFYIAAVTLSAAPALAQTAADTDVNEGVGIIAWLLVGLIGGFLASKVVNHTGEGMIRDIILGIVGAFIGGILFRAFGSPGVTGFNVWSILVAFVGAVILLVVYHAITGSSRTRAV
jgi:uncharacterized membrane protein YeaQ/YmgE (transglycosylase-associated protein family)